MSISFTTILPHFYEAVLLLNFSETIKLNKNIKSFLDYYFNDSILSKKMHYYFLVINQEQDSSIITINPIPIDLGIKEVKPISLIKYNNKIIFVSSIIDYLVAPYYLLNICMSIK